MMCIGGGGQLQCDEQKPAVSFSPQFFLLLLWNQLHACAAAVCALAKAKTLQEKTPEYISQH